jgi:hypothetical protein
MTNIGTAHNNTATRKARRLFRGQSACCILVSAAGRSTVSIDRILTVEMSLNSLSHLGGAAVPPYRYWVGRCCRNAQIPNIFDED